MQLKALHILDKFLKNVVPEYIRDAGRNVIENGGVQKISIAKGDPTTWEVDATIEGEDLQTYGSHIFIRFGDEECTFLCNCPDSFSGVCRHVAAAALRMTAMLNPGETENVTEDREQPRAEWKKTFQSFFGAEIEPETGRHYLIFRFYPEATRLQMAFFKARQNKSGLSSVQTEITLKQIIENPEWCDTSPEFPAVARQIGLYLDYYGHRVGVPDGLLTWLLWTLRREHYLFWMDTNAPCTITNTPMHLKLKPVLGKDGLLFNIYMQSDGKKLFELTDKEITLHGQRPLWVCWNKGFYPVHAALDSALIKKLVADPPLVPKNEMSEFLDRVWSRLPSSVLLDQEEFLEHMGPLFVCAAYRPKLFLGEEGSLLTLEVQNTYETPHGEFIFPGPNPELQTGSYAYEGKTYLIHRSPDDENELINTLLEMNFQPRNNRIWFLEPEEAISFLLDSYAGLVEKYRLYGEQALSRYKVRLSQPTIRASVESEEKEQSFLLDIDVTYDGQSVPLEKLWKAWTQGKRYIQLKDGSYTSLPEAWLQRISHKLEVLGLDPHKPPKNKFRQFEASTLDNLLEDLPDAQTDSFWNSLREKLHSFTRICQLQSPPHLRATLRGYQLHGLSYMNFLREYGFGGILADEMGLGKTVQTLAFLQHLVNQGIEEPNLIVVPTSVLPNWEREADKFVPDLKCLIIYGTHRDSLFKKIQDTHLVITTYALLRRDLEELQSFQFNALILDEAQNIKNPNTITARSVRRINAKMRLCLSGTPIENNLFELWSLFEFLMPGFLGSQHAFQRGVIKPIKDGDNETLEYLRLRVRPFILRRTKAEVAKELPPKIETTQYCALAEEQAELYAALAHKLRDQVMADVQEKGMVKSRISILDALLKLRQICCHPRLLKIEMPGFTTNLPSGKFEAFKDMISDIVEGGHKVLVFSQFVQMLHVIRSWLAIPDIPFAYLDGTSKDRLEQVDRFNNDPAVPIFLISLKAGGTGLNLTAADYVIHYDPWWNPAVENQATDRAHRIGQKNQVFSYKLICQNTVEEKILKLQEQKKGMAEAVIPGQETWKSLTREDLEMLFEV